MDLFDAYFKRADLDHDGRISGAEAVAFLQGSNLPRHVLAQVRIFHRNLENLFGMNQFDVFLIVPGGSCNLWWRQMKCTKKLESFFGFFVCERVVGTWNWRFSDNLLREMQLLFTC